MLLLAEAKLCFNTLLAPVHAGGKIALVVFSSGIAATILTGGRTVHSRIKVPLNLLCPRTCSTSAQTELAELM